MVPCFVIVICWCLNLHVNSYTNILTGCMKTFNMCARFTFCLVIYAYVSKDNILIQCTPCDSTEVCHFHLLHIFPYDKCIALEYLINIIVLWFCTYIWCFNIFCTMSFSNPSYDIPHILNYRPYCHSLHLRDGSPWNGIFCGGSCAYGTLLSS